MQDTRDYHQNSDGSWTVDFLPKDFIKNWTKSARYQYLWLYVGDKSNLVSWGYGHAFFIYGYGDSLEFAKAAAEKVVKASSDPLYKTRDPEFEKGGLYLIYTNDMSEDTAHPKSFMRDPHYLKKKSFIKYLWDIRRMVQRDFFKSQKREATEQPPLIAPGVGPLVTSAVLHQTEPDAA